MALIGYLQITRNCNHRCIFCSNPANSNILSIEEIRQGLKNLYFSGYKEVILTGGEPTIHPNFLESIQLTKEYGLKPRIITNGDLLAKENLVKKIKEYGVHIVHLSFYTYKKGLNDKLRNSPGSFEKIIKAILNLKKYNIDTQITTVISSHNQNHLLKNVLFLKKLNPEIKHFVWNVMDPLMMPQTQKAFDSIPNLNALSDEILKTFDYLTSINNTFRIERIPLCKIPGYERTNTEARKLAKEERRKVIFLDFRGDFEQESQFFRHDYKEECKNCELYTICPGIYEHKKYYKNVKLNPVKEEKYKEKIIRKICGD